MRYERRYFTKRKNLNICHVFAIFLPVTSGGVQHHIISVSEYMNLLGHESLLITSRYRYKAHLLPKTEDLRYLKVLRAGLLSPPYVNKRFVGPFLNLTLNKFDALLGAYTRIRKWNIDFDLLHIHSGYFSLNLGFRLSSWFKRPFIITFHQRHPNNRSKYKKIFNVAEKIVVHRDFTRRILGKWGLEHKTVFIPMFINVEKYRRPDNLQFSDRGNIRILFVGHLEKRRDPLSLLKAFSNVHKQHPNVELHIVGDGSLKKQVKLLIRRCKLERNVFLHGKQLDVRKHLWQSDIYVSTNTVDDYPSLALREAMSAGLAIIDTDVGETSKLVSNGVNGLLIPPSDPIALSNAIITLIEDEKLRKKLSSNAQLFSKNFDVAKCIQPLLKIYHEISGK